MTSKIVKLSQREHVLARPGMYIGSVVPETLTCWTADDTGTRMRRGEVCYTPGLFKIYDEVLVNAVDHAARPRGQDVEHPVRHIKIDVSEDGEISVWNDGDGVVTDVHPAHDDVRCPELIFGHLLTSTNYNDGEGRVVGGMNGIGAKAANIYSKRFTVETVDARSKTLYTQTWEDNMSVVNAPVMKRCVKKPYTVVTFMPDYSRFTESGDLAALPGLTPDMRSLFLKRALDMCAVTSPDVTVWVNGAKLACKGVERYADMYLGAKGERPRAYERVCEGWDVVAACSEHDSTGLDQVSFVNGIWTPRGGRHVEHVAAQIVRRVVERAAARKGSHAPVQAAHVRNHLFLIVRATVPDPTFDGQTKEMLTTPASKFGRRVEVSDGFIDRLVKTTGILELASAMADATAARAAKKTDGAKRSTVRVPKLDDANWAGTARSGECTLILTEGDSARSTAIAGLSVIGRDKFGVFPLRGKMLNVRDVSTARVTANEEISSVKKILGLEAGRVYESTEALRYGRVLVLTDQDVDGSHIKGLLVNVFCTLWPSLFSRDGFLASMATPIVKARRGREEVQFYNLSEFGEWRASQERIEAWSIKYFKGLGTSTAAEAKEYFREMRATAFVNDAASVDSMDLAFNKKRADDRKTWLEGYDVSRVVRASTGHAPELTHSDFVNLELIHFSHYDVERSMPSVVDGLKPSQRKIVHCCFKRGLTSEIRVAQLAGYVSENAAYHHGETSLQGAIVGLAQDFVGSNNVNLLQPNGQFGTRLQGGKDAASARYIHTQLSDVATRLFRREDAGVLEYLQDDGATIEPRHFVPVVAAVLLNGAVGIGTGFSTNVPCYSPADVIANTRRFAHGEEILPMKPWYRGFRGTVEQDEEDSRWRSRGVIARKSGLVLHVSELPIGTWTEDFKEFLEGEAARPDSVLKGVVCQHTETIVSFDLKYANAAAADAALASAAKELRLESVKGLSVSNMHMMSPGGAVRRYEDTTAIIEEHGRVRLALYVARKALLERELEEQAARLTERARFVGAVVEGALDLRASRPEIEGVLESLAFPPASHDALLKLPVSSLSSDRREALKREAAAKLAELEKVRATAPESMWLLELDDLERALSEA
jgi:DNA topoisomerase-2